MFSKKGKKLVAFLLALVMVFGVVPALDYGQGAEEVKAAANAVELQVDDNTGYVELTYSDFGIADQTIAGGSNTGNATNTIVSNNGLDKIAIGGFISFPAGGNTGNYVDIGNLLRFVPTSDTKVALWNSVANNAWWASDINAKATVRGTTIRWRMTFDVSGADYVVNLYINSNHVIEKRLSGGVAGFSSRYLKIGAQSGYSVAVKSHRDTGTGFTELTFSDFNVADGEITYTAGGTNYVSGTNAYVGTSGLDKVAITGNVAWELAVDGIYPKMGYTDSTMTKVYDTVAPIGTQMQLGNLMTVCLDDLHHFNIRGKTDANGNFSNDSWADPIEYNVPTLLSRYIKIRLEFIRSGNDYILDFYANDVKRGTVTLTGGVAAWAAKTPSLQFSATTSWTTGTPNTIGFTSLKDESYLKDASYKEKTFNDFYYKANEDTVEEGIVKGEGGAGVVYMRDKETKDTAGNPILIDNCAYTFYVTFPDSKDPLGNKIQFGDFVAFSAQEESLLVVVDPKTNTSFGMVKGYGIKMRGQEIKLRVEFDQDTATSAIMVRIYVNDAYLGTIPVISALTWHEIFVQAMDGCEVKYRSYYQELTFADFGVENQTFNATSRDYTNSYVTANGWDEVAVTGYVKFPTYCMGNADGILYSGNFFVNPWNNGGEGETEELRGRGRGLRVSQFKSGWHVLNEGVDTGKALVDRYIKLRVAFSYDPIIVRWVVRMTVNDGEYIHAQTYTSAEFDNTSRYLRFSLSSGKTMAVKSYPDYQVQSYDDITISEFGLDSDDHKNASLTDGTYNDTVVADFEENVTSDGFASLSGKIFTAHTTFGVGSFLRLGGTNAEGGIEFKADASGNIVVMFKDTKEEVVTLNPTTAGTTLVGEEIELSVLGLVDDYEGNGVENDLRLVIAINGEKYGDAHYAYDYKNYLGSKLVVGGGISIREDKRELDTEKYDLLTVQDLKTQAQEANGNWVETGILESGTKGGKNTKYAYFTRELNHVAYGSVIEPITNVINGSTEKYWYMRYAGVRNSSYAGWDSLDLAVDQSKNLVLSHGTLADTHKINYILKTGVDLSQMMSIEITSDYMDVDWDGDNDDVKLGIWINGELAQNKYIYLQNYVDQMGTQVLYSGSVNDGYNIYEYHRHKKLLDEEYDLNEFPDGYEFPSNCTEIVLNGKKVDTSSVTSLKKAGQYEVEYTNRLSTFCRNVLVTMLGDSNKTTEINLGDLVSMKKKEGTNKPERIDKLCTDMNNDNSITKEDTDLLRGVLLQRETAEEVKEYYYDETLVGVMSDMHLANGNVNDYQREYNYRQALQFYKNKGVEVLIMNGDVSDLGGEDSYQQLVAIFEEVYADVEKEKWPIVLATADNHEYYPAWWWTSSNNWAANSGTSLTALQGTKELFDTYLSKLGCQFEYVTGTVAEGGSYDATYKTGHSHRVLTVDKGNNKTKYHFISISEDYLKAGPAGYTQASRDWLSQELAEAAADTGNNPIFVAIHHPTQNTVIASQKYGDGNNWFNSVLAQYPQAIVFGSHTHAPIKDERSINQQTYTSINTGSTYYASVMEYPFDNAVSTDARAYDNTAINRYKFSEGLLLRLDGAKTTVERWDFYNAVEAGEDWVIDTALGTAGFKYSYDNQKATSEPPEFSSDATVRLEKTSATAMNVTFDKATEGDNFAHSYKVVVRRGARKIQVKEYTSYFYAGLDEVPDQYSFEVEGLEQGLMYMVQVIPVDSFGQEGAPLTTATYFN